MPVTLPPAAIVQELPAEADRLAREMTENERKQWLVAIRSAPRVAEPCAEANGDEIVVCAPVYDDPARDRIGPTLPDPPTAMEEIKAKLHTRIGPADVGVVSGVNWVGVGVRIKF